MKIPMVDLKEQYLDIKDEVDTAIQNVLDNTMFILGPNVSALENEVAEFCGTSHAVAVASGTDALHLAVRACGVGPGDEVITTPFTFIATAEAITYVGATPVFIDIEADTFNMAPEKIEEKITDKTKAIIPVHLYGQPVDMDPVMEIAEKYGLKVIEDCAQSFGADYKGTMTGAVGDAGCFSFFPSKNLGCYGDGGMIVTNSDDLAEEIKTLRNHGSKVRYYHHEIGYNSRLDEIQAAILRVKLKKIGQYNENRRKNAHLYNEYLEGADLITPFEDGKGLHVFHQYTIMSGKRGAIHESLTKAGISSAIYYPVPLHKQEVFKNGGCQDLLVSEATASKVLSLPIYPEMKESHIQEITSVIIDALK